MQQGYKLQHLSSCPRVISRVFCTRRQLSKARKLKASIAYQETKSDEAVASSGQKKYARQIMIAVDDTVDSAYACQWTLNELYREGDFIHLIHTIPSPQELVEEHPFGQKVILNKEPTDKGINLGCFDKLNTSKVPYQIQMIKEEKEVPSVSQAICDIGSDLEASLVVMSAHTKGFLEEFFRGSHTNYCVHHCQYPVVVLHPPKNGVEEKESAKGGRQIVLAIDNTTSSMEVCKWAMENMYREKDVLHLLHVVPDITPQPLLIGGFEGRMTYSTTAKFQEEFVQSATEAIQKEFVEMLNANDIPNELTVLSQIGINSSEALGDIICNHCKDIGAAAVVVASHNKGSVQEFFMGSVSSFCAHHSKVPVVVLH
eukprot:TRINITY_DN3225_c0_g2_i1.p1 TRINITY_DN3225_c0_g2~~TRINITY_DN3225_c0_g2_i1.p1  ORF type:complete len:371 (-),score=54.99 TRINITY_DN3225_c0_g2_i1:2639-3751(-)